MVKLRDHYFIAWINTIKSKEFYIKDECIYVDITEREYSEYLEEYNNSLKPILTKIRYVVKELNILTSKPK